MNSSDFAILEQLNIDNSPTYDGVLHDFDSIMEWLLSRKNSLEVSLKQISLSECSPWYLDEKEGSIRNEKGSFFKIRGITAKNIKTGEVTGQPIIEQNEIGFLGIICCKHEGTWYYLMQAKIEPGNVNVVQLSPTLQATKSNFTRAHGGKSPEFLSYFTDMNPDDVIVDQIQSEQSGRFIKKRNRNVILKVGELIPEPDTHRWMTLSQIKRMMRIENMVNMDTRTVLSCIPYVLMTKESDPIVKCKPYFEKSAGSVDRRVLSRIYHDINDYKMFSDIEKELVPISKLDEWEFRGNVLRHKNEYPFEVIFCDIHIEGREVSSWKQPLFKANGQSNLGLFCCDDEGVLKFLVKMRPEIGCFDMVEIGPTVQLESGCAPKDIVEDTYIEMLAKGQNVVADTILSEEGGRFYQEENRNSIIFISKDKFEDLPKGYVWSDYGTLNILTQVNNCLNIQLRNLLSLMEL